MVAVGNDRISTRMTDIDDLIARLEAATEGSRELDDEIHGMLGCEYETHCPCYTTSLDAAMMLVPENYINVRIYSGNRWVRIAMPDGGIGIFEFGWSGQAPLALCVAALRARKVLGQPPATER